MNKMGQLANSPDCNPMEHNWGGLGFVVIRMDDLHRIWMTCVRPCYVNGLRIFRTPTALSRVAIILLRRGDIPHWTIYAWKISTSTSCKKSTWLFMIWSDNISHWYNMDFIQIFFLSPGCNNFCLHECTSPCLFSAVGPGLDGAVPNPEDLNIGVGMG